MNKEQEIIQNIIDRTNSDELVWKKYDEGDWRSFDIYMTKCGHYRFDHSLIWINRLLIMTTVHGGIYLNSRKLWRAIKQNLSRTENREKQTKLDIIHNNLFSDKKESL